jgi:hypothetical protein
MSLGVIGAGLPRTGTLSMKAALEELGFGRCYHMEEIFAAPTRAAAWAGFFAGEPTDWDAVFKGYGAAVDAPACFAWRSLTQAYPDAKVVITVRDAEAWLASMYKTIFADGYVDTILASPMGPMIGNMMQVMMALMEAPPPPAGGAPPPGPPPREALLALHRNHNAAVMAGVAPERLLVFEVKQGWGPLCSFLGVDVPSTPFPRINEAEGFHERFTAPVAS